MGCVAYRAGRRRSVGTPGAISRSTLKAPGWCRPPEPPLEDHTLQELLGTYTAGQRGEAGPDPGGVGTLGREHRAVGGQFVRRSAPSCGCVGIVYDHLGAG